MAKIKVSREISAEAGTLVLKVLGIHVITQVPTPASSSEPLVNFYF